MSISEGFYEKAAQICRDIKVSEPLARHTSMKVGGPCKVMLVPSTQAEIIELLRLCFQTKTDVYIMGNGTNLVFSDAGFDGEILSGKNAALRIIQKRS